MPEIIFALLEISIFQTIIYPISNGAHTQIYDQLI